MKSTDQREFILNGNMWTVVLMISFPLAFYNSMNQFFVMFDSYMASYISSKAISAISYINQIQVMLNAIGAALATGSGIIIARYIGAGDYKTAQARASSMLVMVIGIGMGILVIVIPFATEILLFARTPVELIAVGKDYFIYDMIMVVIIFVNTMFIAIEKAKGNTKQILLLNVGVLSLKMILTYTFIVVLGLGVTMMAIASLISHLLITVYAVFILMNPANPLGFKWQAVTYKKKAVKPIVFLSLPIFMEKFLFSFGKLIVNAMSGEFGPTVVGALGVSNHLGGAVTMPANGFGDGSAAIISQNLGNKNTGRAIDAFYKTMMINVIIGTVGFLIMTVFMGPLIGMFSAGDAQFADEIYSIYVYERIAAVTLGMTAAVNGLLFGFGYTRIALYLSLLRLFAFRIPTLYILKTFTSLGSESVGIAMFISNGLVGIAAIIVAYFVIGHIKKGEHSRLICEA